MKEELKKLVADLDKKFGKGTIFKIGESPRIDIELTSSGSILLDEALGGGYPIGRIIEIYGAESCGKTTCTLHAIAEQQKKGGRVAFIDVEHALDLSYAEKLGVDVNEMFLAQPGSGEEALEIVDYLVGSGEFTMVVVDSVAALVPRSELEGEMGDAQMGKQARLMSQACRKLTGKAEKNKCNIYFINQTRSKIGVVYGSPTTTTGGNALKFYASQRLEIIRTGQIKVGEEVVGHNLKIKVVKNKIAPPFKVAVTKLIYGLGISRIDEIIDCAVIRGIIEKKGSWFSYGETKLGQGQAAVRTLLNDNLELQEELLEKIIKHDNE